MHASASCNEVIILYFDSANPLPFRYTTSLPSLFGTEPQNACLYCFDNAYIGITMLVE